MVDRAATSMVLAHAIVHVWVPGYIETHRSFISEYN